MINSKFMVSCVVVGSMFVPTLANASSYFAGGSVTSTTSNIQGSKANIYTPNYPSILSGQSSSAWTMIADSTGNNLGQAGWAVEPDVSSNPHYFYGWITNGYYQEKDSTVGPALGSWHTYQVLNESGQIVGGEDGAYLGQSTENFVPAQVQDAEEVSPTSDIHYIGTSSNQGEFSQVYYWNSGTGSWIQPSLGFVSNVGSALNTNPWQSGSNYWYVWDNH